MSMQLPLWPLRQSVYTRLDTHAAMAAHNLQVDNVGAAFPYIDLGPVTVGDQSTDSHHGTLVIVQIDGWALVSEGGGMVVNQQMDDVTEALTDSPLTVTGFEDAEHMGIQSGQIRLEVTREGEHQIYHGIIQHRFIIFQP